jgi:hypothetical protein
MELMGRVGKAEAEKQNHHRAQRAEVIERVKRQTAVVARGMVAHPLGRPRVRVFVHGDGSHKNDDASEQNGQADIKNTHRQKFPLF